MNSFLPAIKLDTIQFLQLKTYVTGPLQSRFPCTVDCYTLQLALQRCNLLHKFLVHSQLQRGMLHAIWCPLQCKLLENEIYCLDVTGQAFRSLERVVKGLM